MYTEYHHHDKKKKKGAKKQANPLKKTKNPFSFWYVSSLFQN